MKTQKIILLIILAAFVAFAVIGCQAADRPEPARYDRTQEGLRGPDRVGVNPGFNAGTDDIRGIRNNNLNRDATFDDGFNNRGGMFGMRDNAGIMGGGAQDQMTRQLEARVEQIPGVNDANVVVDGATVYVGLDLDRRGQGDYMNDQARGARFRMNQGNQGFGANQAGQAGNVENIKSQVRQVIMQDGNYSNVIISEERNFNQTLGGIANEIRTGRPVADFATNLQDLGRTILPTRTTR
ncbi:hypothetical protein BHU72_04860 [Desulfuribacillus stibiiarsenatis]|uniref:Sporulation protein n=1 Tax=Desulfuribacillus stibiiarsenatis TaxID=1390249 RepID=A0A1E5L5Y9_9FIRM|nr:YhcN/YlaJ family sporulation lipoprotein [Desulfuribacillus stibiiarsenatis]OEH85423.1 hypothetical protein BHU72_04860 [Desulfuribacillus stibiiarsenatis]